MTISRFDPRLGSEATTLWVAVRGYNAENPNKFQLSATRLMAPAKKKRKDAGLTGRVLGGTGGQASGEALEGMSLCSNCRRYIPQGTPPWV